MNRRKFLQSAFLLSGLSLWEKQSAVSKSPTNLTKERVIMAYEWKFNPRPYSDEEAKTLLKNVVSPETTDWHYNTHHKGYVTALNNIEKGLESADLAAANGNYSIVGELQRRFTWDHAGALLHDVSWGVIGGDGDPKKGADA